MFGVHDSRVPEVAVFGGGAGGSQTGPRVRPELAGAMDWMVVPADTCGLPVRVIAESDLLLPYTVAGLDRDLMGNLQSELHPTSSSRVSLCSA